MLYAENLLWYYIEYVLAYRDFVVLVWELSCCFCVCMIALCRLFDINNKACKC